ncbi:CPBP family intramembrane metalloprotease [Aestuariibacter halophilus]|uniref:CPBP family intramembrane metalloprotease n=1 Tax=Fluctibacter halophilus TaxID=226011 RepID=A0ABS8G9J9_9ALTE|nr:CPBP family intramembrane glutamic endopeptidase [Aestuariibacter halophilus]MCC2615886.1 CPBP family intramembrane metalloprotease [Aestuariibacter halophilus]
MKHSTINTMIAETLPIPHHRRWLELVGLFIVTPIAMVVWVDQLQGWLMPVLVTVGMVCFWLLWSDTTFKRFRLWRTEALGHDLRRMLWLFVPGAAVLMIGCLWLTPELFLSLPTQHTTFWLMTLLLYPIISVLPQEIIFRTYFFHRYKHILPDKRLRLLISTLSFALVHGVYGNSVAMLLSLLGGVLFGYRYLQTRSTLMVVIEHSVWGSFLFTVGFGVYLLSQSPV